MVKSVDIEGNDVTVGIYLTIAGCPMKSTIEREVKTAVGGVEGVEQVQQARRLVRSGGLLVMVGVGLDGRLADPVDRSSGTHLVRSVLEEWRELDSDAVIVPVGAGVAAAVMP